MENTMFLSDALKLMKRLDDKNEPIPFSIEYRTFSYQNKTGGNVKKYENVKLMQPPKITGVNRLASKTPFKNPNHFKNRTRNIKLSDGRIKKINILFIEKINGVKIVF